MADKLWTKILGERGNQIRLYERVPDGPIYVSSSHKGKKTRWSLGHNDRTLAISTAYELLASRGTKPEEPIAPGITDSLTLGELVKKYMASATYERIKTKRDLERVLPGMVSYFGKDVEVRTLSHDDFARYVNARRRGSKAVKNTSGMPVRDSTIQHELAYLRMAVLWAYKHRGPGGQRILTENPMNGFRLPSEKNPRRPVMRHETYLQLLGVSAQIGPLFRLALILAEGTGRRIGAIAKLRWEDVDVERGLITWRAENDKKGYESVVPVADDVLTALRAAASTRVSKWVLPAPNDPKKHATNWLLLGQLRRAYKLAGLPKPRGGGWHQLRRKFATERKDYPLKDLMAVGGWRATVSLVAAYQHEDQETMRDVVNKPTKRVWTGFSGHTWDSHELDLLY